jgi:hypothetical protein
MAHRSEADPAPTAEDALAHVSLLLLFDGLDGNGPVEGCTTCDLATAERLWPGWVQRRIDAWAAEASAAATG